MCTRVRHTQTQAQTQARKCTPLAPTPTKNNAPVQPDHTPAAAAASAAAAAAAAQPPIVVVVVAASCFPVVHTLAVDDDLRCFSIAAAVRTIVAAFALAVAFAGRTTEEGVIESEGAREREQCHVVQFTLQK